MIMEKLEEFRKELQALLEKYNAGIGAHCNSDDDYEFTLYVDNKYESAKINCGWSALKAYDL